MSESAGWKTRTPVAVQARTSRVELSPKDWKALRGRKLGTGIDERTTARGLDKATA
jgi:hypothetical protein